MCESGRALLTVVFARRKHKRDYGELEKKGRLSCSPVCSSAGGCGGALLEDAQSTGGCDCAEASV
jgi:hypothetical protein